MRPHIHALSPYVFSSLAILCTFAQGCWDNASTCQDNTDCFVAEQCVQQVCTVVSSPDARPDQTTDSSQDQPKDQPATSCPAVACGQGFVCNPINELCECAQGTHLCGGVCVEDASPFTCGQRCDACEGAADDRAACVDGACVETCGEGTLKCADTCAQCPQVDGGAFVCEGQSCVLAGCEAGQLQCGDSCETCPQMGQPNGQVECSGGDACAVKCEDDAKLCGETCAVCPEGNGVQSTQCTPQGTCEISMCDRGFVKCQQGCCVPGIAPTGPLTGITDTHSDIEMIDEVPLIVHSPASGLGVASATTWDGVQWTTQVIGQGRIDGAGSVVLDDAQTPHVIYLNHATRRLLHATQVNGVWTSNVIGVLSAQNLDSVNWKAVHRQNTIHVVLAEENEVSYITGSAAAWTLETVTMEPGVHRAASLAFGGLQGAVYIAVKLAMLPMQLFARKNNGTWTQNSLSDDQANTQPEHSALLVGSVVNSTPSVVIDDALDFSLGIYQSSSLIPGVMSWDYFSIPLNISANGTIAQSGLGHAFTNTSAFGTDLHAVFNDEIADEAKLLVLNTRTGSRTIQTISPTVDRTRPDMAQDKRGALHYSLITDVAGTPTLTYVSP